MEMLTPQKRLAGTHRDCALSVRSVTSRAGAELPVTPTLGNRMLVQKEIPGQKEII